MDKGANLFAFLEAATIIRRKRVSSYGPTDKVLWLAKVPKERAECRSPFLTGTPEEKLDGTRKIRDAIRAKVQAFCREVCPAPPVRE